MNSNGFDLIDHFPTKSPPTSTVLHNKEHVHVPRTYTLTRDSQCPNHTVSPQLFIADYILQNGEHLRMLERGSSVEAVTLSNQFCDGFPDLQTCVVSRSHAQTRFLMDSSAAKLT
jgi:hypothetical protein